MFSKVDQRGADYSTGDVDGEWSNVHLGGRSESVDRDKFDGAGASGSRLENSVIEHASGIFSYWWGSNIMVSYI